MRLRFIGWALVSALAAAPAVAQPADDIERNPYTSAEDVAAGGRLYRSHCAVCHGLDGQGGRGAALTSGRFRHGASARGLFRRISDGI
ncbi:MAG: c-type cytochrome, partial [Bryobacterales bacterium]|nr:c-type cytochrome [Bryobacterales bacterium]